MSQTKVSCAVPFQIAQQNHYATLSINVQGRLAQGWNGSVVNSWEGEGAPATPPVLVPHVIVGTGFALTGATVSWYRLNSAADKVGDEGTLICQQSLTNNPTGTEYERRDIDNRLYKINDKTGALTILSNLASEGNQDTDVFVCVIDGSILNTATNMSVKLSSPLIASKSATIMTVGANGYMAVIGGAWINPGDHSEGTYPTALSEGAKETKLEVVVYKDGELVAGGIAYHWYKGIGDDAVGGNTPTLTVTEDMVDWQEIFRVEIEADGAVVAMASIDITDQADDYCVKGGSSGELTASAGTYSLWWQLYADSAQGRESFNGLSPFFPTDGNGNPLTVRYHIYVLGPDGFDPEHATSVLDGQMVYDSNNIGKQTINTLTTEHCGNITAGSFYVELDWS